jgi:O-acetyl-ADP-ribose deacetylase (regulator of RNase III)
MRIRVVKGDITNEHADAIVNAANSSLLGGGGVDGAIHRRGGPAILDECRKLRASTYGKGLRVGQAVATTAGELRARWVIHTVGPVYSASEDRSDLLASCYRESLRVADDLEARSIAFPAISTGIYRWPLDSAAKIAVRALRTTATKVTDVRFVLFTPEAYAAFDSVVTGDENIAAGLAAHPADRWRHLFALIDQLTPADREVTWEGGQETSPGVTQMPYPIYSQRFLQVVRLLAELDVVVPFDWPGWSEVSPFFPEGRGLAEAPVADAARLATAYVRGERFNDGALEYALDNGAMEAIFDRLRRWFAEEHPARR